MKTPNIDPVLRGKILETIDAMVTQLQHLHPALPYPAMPTKLIQVMHLLSELDRELTAHPERVQYGLPDGQP